MADSTDATTTLYNFGATLEDDDLVFAAARPGAKQQRCYTEDLRVTAEEVQEWVDFMRERGVQRVISLLSPSEMLTYQQPLVPDLEAAFPGRYLQADIKGGGSQAARQVLEALQAAADAKEKVVVHCWGGGGRSGVVQAAWLCKSRGMQPEEAAAAVGAQAARLGLSRRADVATVAQLLEAAGAGAASGGGLA